MKLEDQSNVDSQLSELRDDSIPEKRSVCFEVIEFDHSYLDNTRDKEDMFVSFMVFSNEIKEDESWKSESFMVLQESPNETLSWVKYQDKKLFDSRDEAMVIVNAICDKITQPYKMKSYIGCSNKLNSRLKMPTHESEGKDVA